MSIKRWFAKSIQKRNKGKAKSQLKEPLQQHKRSILKESDNLGTRLSNYVDACNYWTVNMFNDIGGFVVFTFDNKVEARSALLSLKPIHEAVDSGNLICTEIIVFGYYQRDDGVWQADISVPKLSYHFWSQAKESFAKHNGIEKNSRPPKIEIESPKSPHALSEVLFEKEKIETNALGSMIYRYYKTSDLASAKEFLKQNPVDVNFKYIVVQTPEGKLCRDINGIYFQE